ncbi:hypothetical protein PTKIN_Ptkin13bG0202100 [Pterospermum kingtungense]
MLAELNSGKDKLKALKHELGCKNAVLKAVKSEVGTNKCGEAGPSIIKQSKPKRGSTTKGGLCTFSVALICLRRRSARFKPEEPDRTKDVFEVDGIKFLVSSSCEDKAHETAPVSSGSLVKSKHGGGMTPRIEAQEFRRTSVGRPLRRAAEKVQSYKEIPLTMKLRREE